MARLLSCPHCRAEFAFDAWARGASCPACGRRLSFLELGRVERAADEAPVVPSPAVPSPVVPSPAVPSPAAPPAGAVQSVAGPLAAAAPSAPVAPPARTIVFAPPGPAAAAPAPAPGATPAAGVPDDPPAALWSSPAAPTGFGPRRYTISGKPLHWSAGWTVVAVIWAIVAVGMVTVRVSMGPVTVMTPAETAAIDTVRQTKLPTGASTEAVLRYAATHDLTIEGHVATIPPGGTQMWYVFDRPWEHRMYVFTTLPGTSMMGKNVVLTWTVTGGSATAASATRAALAKTAQTMAHPPSPNSVPAVPGIIPSIPPDLQ
jgi:hypothetical protein